MPDSLLGKLFLNGLGFRVLNGSTFRVQSGRVSGFRVEGSSSPARKGKEDITAFQHTSVLYALRFTCHDGVAWKP